MATKDLPAAAGGGAGASADPGAAAGIYGPDSEAWRLNREAFLLLGAGPRALLLQLAHPLVAEGVGQHSDFRRDPWGRLVGTLRSYLRIVYGGAAPARDEVRRLNRLHESIVGPVVDPDARIRTGAAGYRARDPELSLWVHATLVESTIAVYDAWFEPLSRERRARFYGETVPLGRAFGIPQRLLPADLVAFEAYWWSMLGPGGPVHPTPTARSLAETIVHPPVGPVPPRLYGWLMWPSLALLPPALREEYAIPWSPSRALVARWLAAGMAAWGHRLPATWRWMPQAKAADRRIRSASIGSP